MIGSHLFQDRRLSSCRFPAFFLLALVVGMGCREAARSAQWRGTIDTLPNGAVLVRNPATGLWDSASAWRIVEELRIGEAEGMGPEVFGQIGDFTVDAYGRIYVLDRQAAEIRVFDESGAHVRSIGRKGSGPGEFRDAIGLDWDAQGRLWVVDPGNARYSVFDTAGVYLSGHHRPIGGYHVPWPGGFDTSGRLHDYAPSFARDGPGWILLRFDAAMQSADTFRVPEYEAAQLEIRGAEGRAMIAASLPFGISLEWAFEPRGYVWFGITDRYRIYRQTLESDTVRIIEREYTRLPVTAEEKSEAIEQMKWFVQQGGKVTPADIPDEKPAFDGLFVDDSGRLWVAPIGKKEEAGRAFDVFDPDGRYLGRATSDVPVRLFPRPVFRRDAIYASTWDELGVGYVVRARVLRGRGSTQ